VQQLIERSNAHVFKLGMREKGLRRLEWNAIIARKTFSYGQRLLERTATEGADVADEGRLGDYMYAARQASKATRAMEAFAAEAKALIANDQSPTSPAAQDMAKRFSSACREHGLGDPLTHARWVAGYGHVRASSRWQRFDDATVAAWNFIAEAQNVRGSLAPSAGDA